MSKILELLQSQEQAKQAHLELERREREAYNHRFILIATDAIVDWCGEFWDEFEPYVGEPQPKYCRDGRMEEYVLPVAGPPELGEFKLFYETEHNGQVGARIGYDHYWRPEELIAAAHAQHLRDSTDRQCREEAQAEAEEQKRLAQELYDQYRQLYAAWWHQAQSIIERNKAAIAAYQQELEADYETIVIHYGVYDDSSGPSELSVNTLGRDSDGYWRVLEYNDQIVRRRFTYISATDAPVQRRVAVDGIELQIWRRSDRNLEQYYNLRTMPGADQAIILAHAESLLTEIPGPPAEPAGLHWGDVDRIVRELRDSEDDLPF